MQSETIDAITKAFYTYINPCVCSFGILCNILNLTVLSSQRLKESPFTYLTALAFSDLFTLLFTLSTTFTRGFLIQKTNSVNVEYFLKKVERLFFMPTANVFSVMSASITVALTIERFLFMKFPMHASSYCTKNNARRIITGLFGFILIFRLPMYFFSDAEIRRVTNYTNTSSESTIVTQKVVIVKKFEEYHQLYFAASLTMFEIIPFFLLSILNLSIIILLKKSNKRFATLYESHSVSNFKPIMPKNKSTHSFAYQSASPTTNSKTFNFTNMYSKTRQRKNDELKLTRQLIGLVTLVVLSEICSIITYEKITEHLIGARFPGYMNSPYKLQVVISNNVVLIVHSVNFFLLCVFNAKYFKIFKEKYNCFFIRFYKKSQRKEQANRLT